MVCRQHQGIGIGNRQVVHVADQPTLYTGCIIVSANEAGKNAGACILS
jgi:hypothetical protein